MAQQGPHLPGHGPLSPDLCSWELPQWLGAEERGSQEEVEEEEAQPQPGAPQPGENHLPTQVPDPGCCLPFPQQDGTRCQLLRPPHKGH